MTKTPQDLIYDHLAEVYRDPVTWQPTEAWLQRREFRNTIKGILLAVGVSIGIFAISLTILCGLIGG